NLSEEDWDSVIRVHLKGHFAPSRFAAVYWREQSKAGEPVAGRIINTSSESGLFGNAGQSNYAAAKAGIASMTIVRARERQKYGVTVSAIAPRARTRLTDTVAGADQLMAAKEGEFDAWHPDNMAPLIGFLATDAAADVSGQVFVMWGDSVYLMRGWSLANELGAGGKRWTVTDLIAHKPELFGPVENGSATGGVAFWWERRCTDPAMPDWGELLVDQLRFMARRDASEVAYRDLGSGGSLTFEEWDRRSNALARGLGSRGVEPGDRVAIYLPNEEGLRFLVAYAATHKAGAVAVPTNTRLSVRELIAILGHAEAGAVLTCESLLPSARDVRRALPSLEVLVTDGAGAGELEWDEALDADDSDIQADVGLADLADIMYTSGTTGLPKGVAVRHRNVGMIPNHEPPWTGAGWLHGAPLFTFAGISFIYNPMKMGMVGLYLPKFDAGAWLR